MPLKNPVSMSKTVTISGIKTQNSGTHYSTNHCSLGPDPVQEPRLFPGRVFLHRKDGRRMDGWKDEGMVGQVDGQMCRDGQMYGWMLVGLMEKIGQADRQ